MGTKKSTTYNGIQVIRNEYGMSKKNAFNLICRTYPVLIPV